MSARVRKAIEVSGIVQGVGFRPYVYRLAFEQRLAGFIANTSAGVSIEVEGPIEAVEVFVSRLPAETPRLARITQLATHDIPACNECEFRILPSRPGEIRRVLISPDVAICDDCLRELFHPADRRFHYPFINCTNCGPRYTIVRDIPYDRARTSMAVFPMCVDCQHEYDDPLDRRFHAQPNACWKCGPQVELWDADGAALVPANTEDSGFGIQDSGVGPAGPIAVGAGLVPARDPLLPEEVNKGRCGGGAPTDAIAEAAARLQAGYVVAVKGLGGFHLAVDATNPAAVSRLREGKRRVEKPFAIMAPSVEAVRDFCRLDDAARALLLIPERPIVLLRKNPSSPIADLVAPFNLEYGVFLPYTPLHYLLFAAGRFQALVMTSGNISEEPIAIDNAEAVARLHGMADFFLVHNRDILLRCDDSVVRIAEGAMRQLRRSRGFVPVPVFLKDEQPSVLAVGGELKNTVCLTKGKHAFLSQHIGDLENAESCGFFNEAVHHLERILEIRPEVIAHDLHPDYFSTKWAMQQSGIPLVGVQHHHAHIASCMAENHLEDRVIGFALDGTGYGTDGRIWGGEVLIAGYADFERVAHFEYVAMPGGEAAIREPWRMAVSYLPHHFGREFLALPIPFVQLLDRGKTESLLRMIERNVNSPLTSSCGRLFDAVAALVGIRQKVNYEAQAAIELEMAMAPSHNDGAYPLDLVPDGTNWIIGTRPLFVALLNDLRRSLPASEISRRFHNGLVEGFVRLAILQRECTGLNRVCLSGGTFHNVYLSQRLETRLSEAGFQVFTQKEVPSGDGGLSLGQALVAATKLRAQAD